MTEPFSKTFFARWGDMDFNAHMRNTAYLDVSADVRLLYFQQCGFTARDFERLQIGPVIMRDELEYYRELHLLEPVKVTLVLAGLSEDAARFRLCNEFLREDEKLAAKVVSAGGWLNRATRKLSAPPEKLAEALRGLVRSDDFMILPSLNS